MKFQFPFMLAFAVAAIPIAVLFYRAGNREARARLNAIVAPRLREALTRSVDLGKRRWKAVLVVAALVCVLIALARPQYGARMKEVERTGVDFFIALDLSRSMLAEDVEGQARLEAAKAGIEAFVDGLQEDRVGLIAFAGEAFVAAPVTNDHEAVKRNLRALSTRSITKGGSDLAAAIKLAAKTFSTGDWESKALVFITDGEQLQGDAVIAASQAAREGVAIFTLGVGTSTGAKIPEQKQGSLMRFAKNEFGRDVVTRMNERVLQQVAASGKGIYMPLGRDGMGLQDVYGRGIRPLAKGTRTKPSKELREQFQWPLGLAILLLLAETVINDRRRTVKNSRI